MARICCRTPENGLRALETAGRQERVVRLCIEKSNARYKASELGKERNLLVSKLESTRKRQHAAPKAKAASTRPAAGTPAPTATRPAPVRIQGTVPLPQYIDYRPGTVPYRIGNDGKNRSYLIPDEALKVFDEEFDYCETADSRELTDKAVSLFVGMMSAQAAPSDGGSGGSNDLSWGRRKNEDELDWARRCAREAARMMGKKSKIGRKRYEA